MKDSPELFELIRKLSSNEKRYITVNIRSQSDNPSYFRLFKAIDALKEYNSDKLLASIKNEPFAHRLPAVKHYLHQLILKNLRNFYSGGAMDIDFHESFIDISILYQKNMLAQAEKLLQKVQKEAEQKEMYEFLNLCYLWKRQINYGGKYSEKDELHALYRKQNEINKIIENLNSYRYIQDQLILFNSKKGFVRSKTDANWVKTVLKDPLIANKSKALTPGAVSHHYDIRALCFYMLQDYKQSLTNLNANYQLLEKRIHFDRALLLTYISVGANRSLLCTYLRDYKGAIEALISLRQIPEKARKEKWHYSISDTTIFELEYDCYHYEIVANIICGRYTNNLTLINEMDELVKKPLSPINEKLLLLFNYYSAYTHFVLSNNKQALFYLRRILNYRKEDTLIREDIYCYAKLLYLVIHYEMRTDDFPLYLLKSTYRFLAQRNRVYGVEDAILSFIRNKLLRPTNPKLLTKNFEELRLKLIKITKDPYERKILDYFDFIAWLDSKLSRKSFAEVMKKKYYVE
jgi:hypothetical protein